MRNRAWMTAVLLALAGGCAAEAPGSLAAPVESDSDYTCGIHMDDLRDEVGDLAGQVLIAHTGDDLTMHVYSTRAGWHVKSIYADVGEHWSDAEYAGELPFVEDAPEPYPADHGMVVPLPEVGMTAEPGAEMLVTLHVVMAHLDDHDAILEKDRIWRYTSYAVCADPVTEPGEDPHVPDGTFVPPYDVTVPDIDLDDGPSRPVLPPRVDVRVRTATDEDILGTTDGFPERNHQDPSAADIAWDIDLCGQHLDLSASSASQPADDWNRAARAYVVANALTHTTAVPADVEQALDTTVQYMVSTCDQDPKPRLMAPVASATATIEAWIATVQP